MFCLFSEFNLPSRPSLSAARDNDDCTSRSKPSKCDEVVIMPSVSGMSSAAVGDNLASSHHARCDKNVKTHPKARRSLLQSQLHTNLPSTSKLEPKLSRQHKSEKTKEKSTSFVHAVPKLTSFGKTEHRHLYYNNDYPILFIYVYISILYYYTSILLHIA